MLTADFGFHLRSVAYWLIYFGLIFLVTYVYTAATFSARDLVNRIKRYGYGIPTMRSDEEMATYVDRAVDKLILPHAVFLCVLAAMPYVAEHWLGVEGPLSSFFGLSLLVISAVCLDLVRQIRVELKMDGEWVPVLTAETGLEVELVQGVLQREGIDAVGYGSRVISVLGTLAFWEASRPTLPSLTIHRRLGRGCAAVLVPVDRVEEAREALAAQNIVSG